MRRNPYGFTVESEMDVDEAETRVRRLLKEEGLGVITEINIRKMFQENLGTDFRSTESSAHVTGPLRAEH